MDNRWRDERRKRRRRLKKEVKRCRIMRTGKKKSRLKHYGRNEGK